eukprot:SAG11_NODE_501_length_8895_cov_12.129832_11_plen_751_part_01
MALIELIVAIETGGGAIGRIIGEGAEGESDPAAAVREELYTLKASQLKKRARAAGLSQAAIDTAGDSDDPKTALIELVVAAEMAVDDPAAAALRQQLYALKRSELLLRARTWGVPEDVLDAAGDADDPNSALIDLILAIETGSDEPQAEDGPMGLAACPEPELATQLVPVPEPTCSVSPLLALAMTSMVAMAAEAVQSYGGEQAVAQLWSTRQPITLQMSNAVQSIVQVRAPASHWRPQRLPSRPLIATVFCAVPWHHRLRGILRSTSSRRAGWRDSGRSSCFPVSPCARVGHKRLLAREPRQRSASPRAAPRRAAPRVQLVPMSDPDPTDGCADATGSRAGDAKGAGPGMCFAAAMVLALAKVGYECFSGLCIPGGVDWKVFMLRLNLEDVAKARAKVLIVLQTAAFYQSTPCLKEVRLVSDASRRSTALRAAKGAPRLHPSRACTPPAPAHPPCAPRPFCAPLTTPSRHRQVYAAIQNNVQIIPVRMEASLPPKRDQWLEMSASDDQDDLLAAMEVKQHLNKLNSVPARGTLVEQLDTGVPICSRPPPPKSMHSAHKRHPAAWRGHKNTQRDLCRRPRCRTAQAPRPCARCGGQGPHARRRGRSPRGHACACRPGGGGRVGGGAGGDGGAARRDGGGARAAGEAAGAACGAARAAACAARAAAGGACAASAAACAARAAAGGACGAAACAARAAAGGACGAAGGDRSAGGEGAVADEAGAAGGARGGAAAGGRRASGCRARGGRASASR